MIDPSVYFPQVVSIPNSDSGEKTSKTHQANETQFKEIFDHELRKEESFPLLDQLKTPLKFSVHASQRIKDRKISMDPQLLAKVNDAIDRADAKGVEESLILTPDAAFIVSVKNRTVITAMDRGLMSGNIFTNIDGAVVV